jgi:hypothetical protein
MSPTVEPDDPNLELRCHPRVDLFREIACESGGVVAKSNVADLSVGGMFVDMARIPFAPDAPLTVRFSLREGGPALLLDAEVLYVQPLIGFGLRFVGHAEADRARIAEHVEDTLRRKRNGAPPLRKSARVAVTVPVEVRGARTNGPAFVEKTQLVTLSKHGACLVSSYHLDIGMKLLVDTPRGQRFRGNVVWVGSAASRSEGQVGVQCRGLSQSLGFQFP